MFNPENVKVAVNGVECVPFIDDSVSIKNNKITHTTIQNGMKVKVAFEKDDKGQYVVNSVELLYQYKKRYPKGIQYCSHKRFEKIIKQSVDRIFDEENKKPPKAERFMNYAECTEPKKWNNESAVQEHHKQLNDLYSKTIGGV